MKRLIAACLLCLLALSAFGGVIPSETITPPTEASANSFTTLAWNQDSVTGFDVDLTGTTTLHMWYAGMWQGAPSYYETSCASCFGVDAGGDIHLQWKTAFTSSGCVNNNPCPLPVISSGNRSLTAYRAVGHGYIEWVARFTPNVTSAWAAWWLLGATTGVSCLANGYPTVPVSPAPVYSEIDQEFSYTNDGILHDGAKSETSDSSCGTTAPSNVFSGTKTGLDPTVFHKYGILWSGSTMTYYIDDVSVASGTVTSGTTGQTHLVNSWMAEQCSGTPNSSSCSPPSVIDMYIQSIRYWSCPTWQSNALAC